MPETIGDWIIVSIIVTLAPMLPWFVFYGALATLGGIAHLWSEARIKRLPYLGIYLLIGFFNVMIENIFHLDGVVTSLTLWVVTMAAYIALFKARSRDAGHDHVWKWYVGTFTVAATFGILVWLSENYYISSTNLQDYEIMAAITGAAFILLQSVYLFIPSQKTKVLDPDDYDWKAIEEAALPKQTGNPTPWSKDQY